MKEKILDKATDLFLTLGFKSITMDDLAHEMGISKRRSTPILKIKQNWLRLVLLGLFEVISIGDRRDLQSSKKPY